MENNLIGLQILICILAYVFLVAPLVGVIYYRIAEGIFINHYGLNLSMGSMISFILACLVGMVVAVAWAVVGVVDYFLIIEEDIT